MKKLHLRGILCLSLALAVLFASAVADTAFTFHNGVTWVTTVSQMLAAEGVHDYDANVHQNPITERFTRHFILDRDGIADTFYVYQGDMLVMMYFLIPKDTKAVPVYALKAEEYKALYGAPVDFSAIDLYALYNVIWPDRFTPEDIERIAAWRLADGTLAVLHTFRGGNVMAYLNEVRITVAAAKTANRGVSKPNFMKQGGNTP